MDGFIKWNCYDLAEQTEVFDRCRNKLNIMHDELMRLFREVDGVNFEKSDQLRKILSDITEISHRLNV